MDSCAWLIQLAEESLAAGSSRDPLPPLPPPESPEEGFLLQQDVIALAEAFGLPPPSREPIVHGPLLL